MNHCEIKKTFMEVFKGQTNIMTPDVLQYGQKGPYLYELSEGEGFSREKIYGVTILTRKGEKTQLSKCCGSLAEAKSYIKTLHHQTTEVET